ncbi:hypothetical protein MMC26_005890 [Xylographa opegraphella]|nr:hypothetical protein [Xylographa opegraphella]
MALVQGVKLEVISDGRTLPFYQNPDIVHDVLDLTEKRCFYIEAITNAKFYIRITLTEDFEWLSGTGANLGLGFDGGKKYYWMFRQEQWLRNGKSSSKVLYYVRRYDPEKKLFRKAEFIFGHLELQESDEVNVMPPHIDQLGTIRVDIQRAKLLPSKSWTNFRKDEIGERVSSMPEKALKGKAVTNTVGMVVGDLIESNIKKQDHAPLTGPDGRHICIDILYRSRHVLQMLGCIPRTPSPGTSLEPTTRSEQGFSSARGTPAVTTDSDQEIRNLRARLAILEQNRNIKSEPLHPCGDSSTPARRVKREGTDIEIVWERKRPRKSGPIEVVDLTDD